MTDLPLLKPTLYARRDGTPPVLLGGRCACGYTLFQMQTFGCERCGRFGDALQPYRSVEEVLAGKPISGTLTALQCCPVGEGAAAVIVVSEDAIKRHGLDASRAIRVAARRRRASGPARAPMRMPR